MPYNYFFFAFFTAFFFVDFFTIFFFAAFFTTRRVLTAARDGARFFGAWAGSTLAGAADCITRDEKRGMLGFAPDGGSQ